jgi:hypothetical protein
MLMSTPAPIVGDWYETQEGESLEVVAYDPEEETVEVQFFDGTVEEYDLDTWNELGVAPGEPPEDWSGSLDVKGEDYGVDLDRPAGDSHNNPLEDIESYDETGFE